MDGGLDISAIVSHVSSTDGYDSDAESYTDELSSALEDEAPVKAKKDWSTRKKELHFQRRESRMSQVTSEGEGQSHSHRSRGESIFSRGSRGSKSRKARSKSRGNSGGREIQQDRSIPEKINGTVVDENAELTIHSGKIIEYSPQNQYGRFNILLGEGAYKKVYVAYDTKNGYEVAWNVIKMKNVTPQLQMRIVYEMKMLNTLDHDSILKFHTCWRNKQSNCLCFITEVMHSGTLSDFVQTRPVRLRIMKRWCRHILNALVYLHEEHQPAIIHRDLKLDNIFVNGSSGEIRIGDLGLASWERIGQAKSVLGTPEYIAPEMYNESYDEKVDIYAFGLCALEMISKQIPYRECTNAPQIYMKVMNGEPPKAFTKLKESGVKAFISCCIAPPEEWKTESNPSGRPTASQLLEHDFLSRDSTEEEDDMLCEDFLENLTDTDEVKSNVPPMPTTNLTVLKPTSSHKPDSRLNKTTSLGFLRKKSKTNDTAAINRPPQATSERNTLQKKSSAESTIKIPGERGKSAVDSLRGKSEVASKESYHSDSEEGIKQIGSGTSSVKDLQGKKQGADSPIETDKGTIDATEGKTYFRWMIQARSLQKEYRVSEEGHLVFDPVIKIECQTDEGSGDFNFDTSNDEDVSMTHLIIQALMLEDSEYGQLLENIQAVRRQYETFKKRLQEDYSKQNVVPNKIFRYATFNSNQKPPQLCEESASREQEVLIDTTANPSSRRSSALLPHGTQSKDVHLAFQPVEPIALESDISSRSLERQNTSRLLDFLNAKEETEIDPDRIRSPVSPLSGSPTDNPSLFPFINESNEKHDQLEAIETLKRIESKLATFIPTLLDSSTPTGRNREVLLIAKAFLAFLEEDSGLALESEELLGNVVKMPVSVSARAPKQTLLKTVSSQSLPMGLAKMADIDPNSVEDLMTKLATPPPNPNELKTLDPPIIVLRNHSATDLSQNSDNSTSVHTTVNSTNSLLETVNDNFKPREVASSDILVTPEKETNFDSLFPSASK